MSTILEDIYNELSTRGAVTSARHYSVDFLRMGYGYYAERRQNPSAGALRGLYISLREQGHIDLAHRVAAELLGGFVHAGA